MARPAPCRLGEDPNYCLTHRQWACPYAKRRPEVIENTKREKAHWEAVKKRRLQTAAPKAKKSQWDMKAMKAYMEEYAHNHIDGKTMEVNSTSLAEDAASMFDAYENTSDYKIPDEIFELAAEVAESIEAHRKASVVTAGDDLRTLAVSLYRGILGKAGHEVAKAIQDALKQAFELGQQGKTAAVISAEYTESEVRDWMEKHAPSIGGERGGFDPQELAKQAAEYFGIDGDIPEWVYDAAMNVSASTRHVLAARLLRAARKLAK